MSRTGCSRSMVTQPRRRRLTRGLGIKPTTFIISVRHIGPINTLMTPYRINFHRRWWWWLITICQDPKKTSKSHFAIGSDPIESKALYYHYLDLPILRTSADLEYYHSHSADFFLIVLHLSDHMIIGCRHPGCLTAEYTFVFFAIFSYLLCFTFSSVLKSVLPFVLVQF